VAREDKTEGRWHQKPGVLAAIIGGVSAIVAALVAGMFSILNSPTDPPPEKEPNSMEINVTIALDQLNALSAPGEPVGLSSPLDPPTLRGIKLDENDPYHIDFIFDKGSAPLKSEELSEEVSKLVHYFLTALSLPEEEFWVNLSPYEKDKIIPERFAKTRMGWDFLGQDYLLKQVTASLVNPENEVGEEYWESIYATARKEFGTTDLEFTTFNKVWIVPEEASVYLKNGTALISGGTLAVKTDRDYLASKQSQSGAGSPVSQGQGEEAGRIAEIASQACLDFLIPRLTEDVNTGANFGTVRQAFSALILATWYKQTLRNSLLHQSLSKQQKVPAALVYSNAGNTEALYQRYLAAFQKGVFDFIQEDYDPITQDVIPRKYFSGGITAKGLGAGVSNRKFRTKIPVAILQSAVLLVHVSMFDLEPATAASWSAPAGNNAVVAEESQLEEDKKEIGGIDFGIDFDLAADGDETFTFTPEALAMKQGDVELSPRVLKVTSFPSIDAVMKGPLCQRR
jgi:hypothetical protein